MALSLPALVVVVVVVVVMEKLEACVCMCVRTCTRGSSDSDYCVFFFSSSLSFACADRFWVESPHTFHHEAKGNLSAERDS